MHWRSLARSHFSHPSRFVAFCSVFANRKYALDEIESAICASATARRIVLTIIRANSKRKPQSIYTHIADRPAISKLCEERHSVYCAQSQSLSFDPRREINPITSFVPTWPRRCFASGTFASSASFRFRVSFLSVCSNANCFVYTLDVSFVEPSDWCVYWIWNKTNVIVIWKMSEQFG